MHDTYASSHAYVICFSHEELVLLVDLILVFKLHNKDYVHVINWWFRLKHISAIHARTLLFIYLQGGAHLFGDSNKVKMTGQTVMMDWRRVTTTVQQKCQLRLLFLVLTGSFVCTCRDFRVSTCTCCSFVSQSCLEMREASDRTSCSLIPSSL